jgi:hypothetical protein
MIRHCFTLALAAGLLAALAACGDDAPSKPAADTAPPAPSPFLAKADLPDAVGVFDVKERKAGDEVAVYGRVADMAPGFAAFTLVDEELEYCGQSSVEDDHCTTPWDYCCIQNETRMAASIPIEFRNEKGEPVESKDLGVRPLDLVALKGTLEKTQSGGLMVVTKTGWFRRERPETGDHIEWP